VSRNRRVQRRSVARLDGLDDPCRRQCGYGIQSAHARAPRAPRRSRSRAVDTHSPLARARRQGVTPKPALAPLRGSGPAGLPPRPGAWVLPPHSPPPHLLHPRRSSAILPRLHPRPATAAAAGVPFSAQPLSDVPPRPGTRCTAARRPWPWPAPANAAGKAAHELSSLPVQRPQGKVARWAAHPPCGAGAGHMRSTSTSAPYLPLAPPSP
jgi:hypothetical protein